MSVWQSTNLTPSALQPTARLLVPIEVIQPFIPDINLIEWKRHNISYLSDLMSHTGKLVPLEHLLSKFSLPPHEMYRYLQIKHLFQSLQPPAMIPLHTPIAMLASLSYVQN